MLTLLFVVGNYLLTQHFFSTSLSGSLLNDLGSALPVLLIATLAAGVWRSVNWRGRWPQDLHPLLSSKGALIGAVMGATLLGASQMVGTVAGLIMRVPHVTLAGAVVTLGVSLAVTSLIGLPAGGITGAISRYLFWWADNLPERTLQVIGLQLIIAGFLAQAVFPVAGFFDLANL
jgi:hypothetical protein